MTANNDAYEGRDLATIRYRKRPLVIYPIQAQEFDVLASGHSSIRDRKRSMVLPLLAF